MKTHLYLLLLLTTFTLGIKLRAQVAETFDDGNFTTNPTWLPSTPTDWMVNSSRQLQSNNTTANHTFYISTENRLATTAQWEFTIRLHFNPSSANFVDVFLIAADSNLTKAPGYFVRIGNTDDEIALYRKDLNGTSTKIIDGVNGTTNSSDNVIRIKVTRDAANQFTLYRATDTANRYVMEGVVTDATFTASAYFGFLVKQSTASFFQKHFVDDITIQPFAPDATPPAIKSVTPTSVKTLTVTFSEPVTISSAQTFSNYFVDRGVGTPIAAHMDTDNEAAVHLTFANAFTTASEHVITIHNIEDMAGNRLHNATATFNFRELLRYDVVMDEIMADPTPVAGLPNAEYIELKNTSGSTLSLQGWQLTTTTASSGAFPDYQLPADSFVVLTSASQAPLLAPYGNVLAVPGFPSLDNEGTTLTLFSNEGQTIHALAYTKNWYQNKAKEEGGWSLEMIDTNNPCTGIENWQASTHPLGGTPGKTNAVNGINKDETPPALKNAFLLNNSTIVLTFSEPLDSTNSVVANQYNLHPERSIVTATVVNPLLTQVVLQLADTLNGATVYTITVSGVTDCSGNMISSSNKVSIGMPLLPAAGDAVINELLFNPKPGGHDYIELYNRGTKIIDASQLYLANRNSQGALSNLKKLSTTPYYLFPGDYVVLTENANLLSLHYFVKNLDKVLELPSLPSYPDAEGTVVLVSLQGAVIDEVRYKDDWHFALLKDAEGVALERIDPHGPAQDKSNWHSAATTAGYGTPTYKNSQYLQPQSFNATITVTPNVFSPDNDGTDDIAVINYAVAESGAVANIFVFDAAGRQVRHLVKNNVLGNKGTWTWDGLTEQRKQLPTGTYIIYTELFNLQGKKQQFKNTIVLTRKF